MAVSVRPATDAVEQQLESGSLDASALGAEVHAAGSSWPRPGSSTWPSGLSSWTRHAS